MMNYVLDRNADVRQVCFILIMSAYRVINCHPFCYVTAVPYDENDSVLQAACYGCGVMAQYGGEEYITACTGR